LFDRLASGSYSFRLVKGFLFSFGGISLIVYLSSVLYSVKLETAGGGGETLFYMLIVGPSEEFIFRFFVPLLVMYWFNVGYLVGGLVGAIRFSYTRWYAYGGVTFLIGIVISSGIWQAVTVYLFSNRNPFNFSPGFWPLSWVMRPTTL